jgi:predicted helicase
MQNIFDKYIQSISSKFSHKETSEMGYRTDFEILLKGIFKSIKVQRIDHDARAKQGNKPDFVVINHDVPILYIEAKDIGVPLDKVEKSEQMARYYGYANLVLTDYVEFRFYRNGVRYEEPIIIASYDLKNRILNPLPQNYNHVAKSLLDFTQKHKEPIRSGEHLSKIMGGKAQRIRDNVKQFLAIPAERNVEITRIYETFKKLLVHDLSQESFADMYAQTLVYGLFVARYHDETPETFSRQEARELVPASNPLLRHFFDHIVGPNFDKRLEYIVNELCEVFLHANVQELMKQYYQNDLWGKVHEGPDPVIHFYEDFLKEYDPELRKKLGAFYTPLPVVRFIVRSVDHLLEKDFGLASGLADTSKSADGNHRVQILDPAAGTGTFISATIRTIYKRLLDSGQKGRWPAYVHHDLLPRLHGFEIMMAPYTIAHLKLSMAFKETGFWNFHRRLGIYLTNSLEESGPQIDLFTGFGLAESIAEESKEAEVIKNKTPIMVVIGNPPYSVSSSNKGEWITDLIKDYKTGLGEKNIQSLSDDYIKFIRFAEHFVEKNKSGIVAMITNNSFIDGITHRQMRKHLLETFDEIYILDLHGNSKKKEKAPDGDKDENVFDIQQGVAISIFVRQVSQEKTLCAVYHGEIYGKRKEKFQALDENDLQNIKWKKLDYSAPYYFFVPKNFMLEEEYEKGFKIDELFVIKAAGIKTHHDDLVIAFSSNELKKQIMTYQKEQNDLYDYDKIKKICYRPFDERFIYYDTKIIIRHRKEQIKHSFHPNLVLLAGRQSKTDQINHFYITNLLSEMKTAESSTGSYHFPLYLYDDDQNKTSNLLKEIVDEMENITGQAMPEDIFDYIYAVLYSPSYREKYKEFLKIDFPRVPYPKDKESFKKIVAFGSELRLLHLLESPKVNQFITTYPVAGSDNIESISYKNEKVIINIEQYFGNVPEVAWNFYIGGYQPAQKWLKDRKGRTLTNQDIEHYQKIIVALTETDRIMKEIV